MGVNNLANLGQVQSANLTTDPSAQVTANPGQTQRLAGKYNTVEELARGYDHQMAETQRIIAQRDEAVRKAQLLESFVRGGGSNDRVMPNDRIASRQSPFDEITDALNVDRNTLRAALAEIVSEQLAPVTAVMAARQTVGADFPEFGQFEPEVAQFLNSHPEVNEEYRTMISDPRTAAAGMRYAYLMFERGARAQQGQTGQEQQQQADMSGQAQAAARLDAMLPGGGVGGRAQAMAAASEAQLKAEYENSRRTGDWSGYLANALGDLSAGH
jgi:hypothetical protein